MFGFGSMFPGLSNAFAMPPQAGVRGLPGQGGAYPAIGQFGQNLMQSSAPRFASQGQAPLTGGPVAGGSPLGGFGGMMQPPQSGIPPWLLQMLQQRMQPAVGQASQGQNVYGPTAPASGMFSGFHPFGGLFSGGGQ